MPHVFPRKRHVHVTTAAETTTLVKEDGTLTVPLRLEGPAQVAIERADGEQ